LGTSTGTTVASNLLSQGFAQGETLTIDIGGTTNTITFGTNGGAGEVSTLAELSAALAGISGGTASIDASGNLSVTGASDDDNIIVGGSATLSNLGLTAGTFKATNLLTQNTVTQGQTLTVEVANGGAQTITFGTGVGEVSTLAELNTALSTLTGVTASVNTSNGNISIVASGLTDEITLGGTANVSSFGTAAGDYLPAQGAVVANDNTTFLESSIAGGAITVYDDNGSPINVQFRWAKVDSVGLGGSDTWNLFYLEDPDAIDTEPMWRNAGQDYTFGSDGTLSPVVTGLSLTNIMIAGANIASLELTHGADGLTQFDNPNGNAKVNTLSQDGMPSGELIGIQISDGGRIVGNYSNGLSLDIYEIPLVSFNADDGLKRIDGGAYEATSQSGQAVTGANGSIVGQALENSNTDIADEFSKLIVTQQAYSANSRIISTSDEMLQEALNMVR
ncbi:MAG: flagellar hook-basal body complex protein, partial [Rhizobiales bacterium]|nr:flagellar hook-basal body complex protein [Hyphomicrobiales bacterium]